ncbi:MAG: ABC transporter substrate-binding protein [Chloroflexi bacterium]|nr:ABC transporter substrate-binding protein [Chloroflexota bacterium]
MNIRNVLLAAAHLAAFLSLLGGCAPSAAPPQAKAVASPASAAQAAPTSFPAPTAAAPAPSPKPAHAGPNRGGTLRVLVSADPRTYDLHTELSYTVLAPIGPAYNGLVEYDDEQTSKIIPALAEKWDTSADGRIWTFYLRKDVRWQDGTRFNAADVEYSMKRLMANSPNLKDPLAFVQKVETRDENTVVVTLTQPRPVFMTILADNWAAIMPKSVIEARGDMKRTVVGTGPFKFKSHDVGASLHLVRNADYFVKGKPYLDGLAFYPIRDVATALAAFRSKRVDITGILVLPTPSGLTLQREEREARVGKYPSLGWWNFVMPVDKAPWNDIRVRRAVYLTLDRDAFVKIIEQGFGSIGSFVPAIMGGATPEELKDKPGFRQPKDADRAEAKRLLQEAGYGNGFPTRMLHRTGEPFQSGAVLLKSELAKIGIMAELDPQNEADYYEVTYRGAYHSFLSRASWKLPDADGLLPVNYRSTSVRNYSRLIDEETDKLIDLQSITTDAAKRKEILREIDRRLTESLPAVTTHWFDYFIAWWPSTIRHVLPLTFTSNVRYAGVSFVK